MTENFEINVSSLVSSVQHKLGNSHLRMPPTNCIFKTPSILFRHSPRAFLPNCFSIGPIHHGKVNLVVADKIKFSYMKNMLTRVASSEKMSEEEVLNELVYAVKKIEKEASSYYAGHDFSAQMGDGFSEMLLLDGCFLIELFRKYEGVIQSESDDPIFSMSCMLQFLNHDLILLENQIPWLVLEILFDITKHPSEFRSLIQLVIIFFANMFTSHPSMSIVNFETKPIKHILDLLRWSLVLPSQECGNRPWSAWQPIQSITRLKEAGVKFKRVVPDSVLDIKFRNGILEIPSLLIQETDTILRNLIAYEQCFPNCQPIFTCYAKLLSNLIDKPRDIEILCEKDIVNKWLSPDDAAQFFNNLYVDTYTKEFYYSELCDNLNYHCQRWWPRWRAFFVRNRATATTYAFIMFILAFWQALGNLPHKSSH